MKIYELNTDRLRLRQWTESDYTPFARLNADPLVMEYFPATLSTAESARMAEKIKQRLSEHGWGFWAAELKSTGEFIGFVGLNPPKPELPFSPCVEIGWRLDRKFWGNGYATEAGRATLDFAFGQLKLEQVVSFTSVLNRNSRAVMERLGMRDTGQNFMHPDIPVGHPLGEHVLYKIIRSSFTPLTFFN